MFCMGCGAETPPDADRCPVCGREIARLPGDARPSAGDRAAMAAVLASPSSALGPTAAPAPAPSISAGELDTPGLPRDAAGLALLIAVLAMMLDLLAPWINKFGHRTAPADVGAPILLAVAVLAVALIPLSRPSLRLRPAAAVLPIVVGGVAFGPAALGWIILAIIGNSAAGGSANCAGCAQPAYPTYPVADFGLYLFLFGAGVLVYTGYQMFLAAARAGISAPAAALTPAPAMANAAARGADGLEDADVPGGDGPAASRAGAAPVIVGVPAPSTPQAAAAPRRVAAKELTLPGSASWNAAPPPPHVARPSSAGGWRRQGNPRHP